MGPTASGKTDLAIALSQQLPIDIISVDSALIYKGMDIGTAKPTKEELNNAPHALIDICDPWDSYSAADFCRDAEAAIDKSHAANRIPLLVGGTMMYFNALIKGMADMPATDDATRKAIEAEAKLKGWPALHQELQQIDPESAEQIHPNHSQRLARAIAVYRISGKTMSSLRKKQEDERNTNNASDFLNKHHVTQLALIPQHRSWLHERIKQRFHHMLDTGFMDEIQRLYRNGNLHLDLPSMRAVGYRQAWQFLDGEYDHDIMIEKGIAATRQLAKRQLTWLRGWENLHLLNAQPENMTLTANLEANVNKSLKIMSFKSI